MTHRQLTDSERQELDALNDAVTSAIATRRAWLDAKVLECSTIKPGDMLYEVCSGMELGRVSKIKRFWRDRDEGVRDTSPSCFFEYETSPGSFDNTSRQSLSAGTREQAVEYAERHLRWLTA